MTRSPPRTPASPGLAGREGELLDLSRDGYDVREALQRRTLPVERAETGPSAAMRDLLGAREGDPRGWAAVVFDVEGNPLSGFDAVQWHDALQRVVGRIGQVWRSREVKRCGGYTAAALARRNGAAENDG